MESGAETLPRSRRRPSGAEPELPPGPGWTLAGSTIRWWRRPLEVLERARERYGDVFTLRVAHEDTWVMLSDPEHVKQVFTGDPRLLHAGEANTILLPVVGDRSVLLLDEGAHMRERKLMLPPFHGKRMQRYGELMAEIAAAEIERWPKDRKLRMRPRMQAVTLEVILRAVFGVADNERLRRFRHELRTLLEAISDPRRAILPVLLGPERIRRFPPFRRKMEKVDGLLFEEVAARRRAGDLEQREDILSLLLQARDDDGEPISDPQLRDELMTLLVAGHETTATALAWAIELLARHPAQLERLESELAAGEDEYLDAVIKETLRLRPVVALVLRHLTEPMEIGGHLIPAGVALAPCIYLVHRRPDVYPEPERFRPERFLEGQDKTGARTYTWIPFGGGVRRCLGGAFAEFEMAVVLRELIRRRRIRPASDRAEHPVRRTITNVPSRGGEVFAGPR
ncbi:MAG: cytochrome P450 [Solirubrobacterales bacterium]